MPRKLDPLKVLYFIRCSIAFITQNFWILLISLIIYNFQIFLTSLLLRAPSSKGPLKFQRSSKTRGVIWRICGTYKGFGGEKFRTKFSSKLGGGKFWFLDSWGIFWYFRSHFIGIEYKIDYDYWKTAVSV